MMVRRRDGQKFRVCRRSRTRHVSRVFQPTVLDSGIPKRRRTLVAASWDRCTGSGARDATPTFEAAPREGPAKSECGSRRRLARDLLLEPYGALDRPAKRSLIPRPAIFDTR